MHTLIQDVRTAFYARIDLAIGAGGGSALERCVLGVPGFDFETSQDVLARATNAAAGTVTQVPAAQLSNAVTKAVPAAGESVGEPVVASIYQLDGLVRRSTSLQLTADARLAREGVAA